MSSQAEAVFVRGASAIHDLTTLALSGSQTLIDCYVDHAKASLARSCDRLCDSVLGKQR